MFLCALGTVALHAKQESIRLARSNRRLIRITDIHTVGQAVERRIVCGERDAIKGIAARRIVVVEPTGQSTDTRRVIVPAVWPLVSGNIRGLAIDGVAE